MFTDVALGVPTGLLRSKRLDDGTWQSVVDLRVFPADAIPANARLQALGLADLFVALNS